MPRGKEFSQLPKSNIASSIVEDPMSANRGNKTGFVGAASPTLPNKDKLGENKNK
ncbi:hypothetical protein [Bacillus sp. T3]|uniref:hypothetical protein n=1 Tax=Bacillus sp. T3 TaxID=467262 RepID=UPI002980AF0A|nr:hypothetical protein [Bacillus sp. T3]